MRCSNRCTYLFPLCHLMTIARTRARFNLLVLAEIITSVAFEFCCTAGVILRWKFCSGIRGRRSSLRACAHILFRELGLWSHLHGFFHRRVKRGKKKEFASSRAARKYQVKNITFSEATNFLFVFPRKFRLLCNRPAIDEIKEQLVLAVKTTRAR